MDYNFNLNEIHEKVMMVWMGLSWKTVNRSCLRSLHTFLHTRLSFPHTHIPGFFNWVMRTNNKHESSVFIRRVLKPHAQLSPFVEDVIANVLVGGRASFGHVTNTVCSLWMQYMLYILFQWFFVTRRSRMLAHTLWSRTICLGSNREEGWCLQDILGPL